MTKQTVVQLKGKKARLWGRYIERNRWKSPGSRDYFLEQALSDSKLLDDIHSLYSIGALEREDYACSRDGIDFGDPAARLDTALCGIENCDQVEVEA